MDGEKEKGGGRNEVDKREEEESVIEGKMQEGEEKNETGEKEMKWEERAKWRKE